MKCGPAGFLFECAERRTALAMPKCGSCLNPRPQPKANQFTTKSRSCEAREPPVVTQAVVWTTVPRGMPPRSCHVQVNVCDCPGGRLNGGHEVMLPRQHGFKPGALHVAPAVAVASGTCPAL